MELLGQGQARLVCVGEQLVLHLSARLFQPEMWAKLCRGFKAEEGKGDWVGAPFRVMTLEEEVPGYPRWKRVTLDGLSWVVFQLLVPHDHKLVRLWQTVDWVAINRLCAGVYNNSRFGQRAWAPAQMFALLLLYFILPLSSECHLVRTVAIVPLYRWFCGFGLFSPLPDHSTLYDFRKKIKPERFEVILTWVVWNCKKAGLISNELLHFDMTAVAASSRPWSPYERAVLLTMALMRYWDRQVGHQAPSDCLSQDELHRLMAEVAIEVLENKSLKKNPKAPAQVLRSVERWTERRQQAPGQSLWDLNLEEVMQVLLTEEGEPNECPEPNAHHAWLTKIAKGLKAHLLHAVGDCDARMGWINNVQLVCGYWLGFLVDNCHGVITAVRTVPLNVDQRSQMTTALEVHRERVGAYRRQSLPTVPRISLRSTRCWTSIRSRATSQVGAMVLQATGCRLTTLSGMKKDNYAALQAMRSRRALYIATENVSTRHKRQIASAAHCVRPAYPGNSFLTGLVASISMLLFINAGSRIENIHAHRSTSWHKQSGSPAKAISAWQNDSTTQTRGPIAAKR